MSRTPYETFEHGADIGVRGFGATPGEAFANAARALTAVVTDAARIRPQVAVEIRCKAPGLELLLVDWLNALVYEMATRRLLFCRFDVRVDGNRLEARAWGEPVDRRRHEPAVEVKGATYTGLSVREGPEGWVAECVVDV